MMRSIFVIMVCLVCCSRSTLGEEEKPRLAFVDIANVKELDCVERWEQLCARSPAALDAVYVMKDTVQVWVLDTVYAKFRIVSRSTERLNLELTGWGGDVGTEPNPSGRGQTAVLEIPNDGQFRYVGPDIARIAGDRDVARISVQLVPRTEYRKKYEDLVRRFVPGGKCMGESLYKATGKADCINKPASSRQVSKPNQNPQKH
jgi:hypothetical protein